MLAVQVRFLLFAFFHDNDGIHRVAAGDLNSVFRVPATPVECFVMRSSSRE